MSKLGMECMYEYPSEASVSLRSPSEMAKSTFSRLKTATAFRTLVRLSRSGCRAPAGAVRACVGEYVWEKVWCGCGWVRGAGVQHHVGIPRQSAVVVGVVRECARRGEREREKAKAIEREGGKCASREGRKGGSEREESERGKEREPYRSGYQRGLHRRSVRP